MKDIYFKIVGPIGKEAQVYYCKASDRQIVDGKEYTEYEFVKFDRVNFRVSCLDEETVKPISKEEYWDYVDRVIGGLKHRVLDLEYTAKEYQSKIDRLYDYVEKQNR